ncbi:MAG: AMP phosphorylase [Candidatus Diapherotrites archaeon]|nr:AMP phosphorylase [Candidatus Diapherotrites archaeon]
MGSYAISLNARILPIRAGKPVAILGTEKARELGIMPLDRIEIFNPREKKRCVAIVDVTKTFVSDKEIGLFEDLWEDLKVIDNEPLSVRAIERPKSVDYIKKKILGENLTEAEIRSIVNDIDKNRISDIEAGAFLSAVYIHGYNMEETIAMTKAIIENGKTINFGVSPIVDKHSIGGTNGRATMVIVPIVAASGIYIPKTSSRSITSAAGTADAMEVLANVCLSDVEIKEITKKIGGVIAWGGALNLAPVDEKIISIEYPLSLNPQGQIIASVLAKKASVGSQYVVIDIPIGKGLKIENKGDAEIMAGKFIEVGKKLGMHIEVVITDGNQPCGPAFGPALEAKHAMEILEGKRFDNLAQKSCELAGVLFELTGRSKRGKGTELAKKILQSGKALKKMKEIIKAQKGTIFKSSEIELANYKADVISKKDGVVSHINIRRLTNIARVAGAPYNKKSGVLLNVESGTRIRKGTKLYQIYAENESKLKAAVKEACADNGIELGKIIIKKIE